MSLYNYLVESNRPYEEIRYDFRPEEVQQLYNLLLKIGGSQFRDFVVEHLTDILKYISLSPSQRLQKKWVNHPENLLIRFAALQISASTVSFLSDAEDIADFVDRGSYRSFHAVIAQALAPFLLKMPLFRFPFEGFDNPFLKS